jgi:hypothetical protein
MPPNKRFGIVPTDKCKGADAFTINDDDMAIASLQQSSYLSANANFIPFHLNLAPKLPSLKFATNVRLHIESDYEVFYNCCKLARGTCSQGSLIV